MRGRPAFRNARETVRAGGVALRARLLHNLSLKLGALALALVFWFFVVTDDTLVGQRTLRTELRVEGLAANELVAGLPAQVRVRLSGPSNRLRALESGTLEAVLNLRDATGEFEQPVRVFPPQGMTLLSVTPGEILGAVELRSQKQVTVQVVILTLPADAVLEPHPSPRTVRVGGSAAQLGRVTRVLALYDPTAPTPRTAVYAVDARGVPVLEVTVTPAQVKVALTPRPILFTRTLPLQLNVPVAGAEVVAATLTQREVVVAGPKAVLDGLTQVTAALSPGAETSSLSTGRSTFLVILELPEGVVALSAPRLTVQVRVPGRGSPNP